MARQRVFPHGEGDEPITRRYTKSGPVVDGTKMMSWRSQTEVIKKVYTLADYLTERNGRFYSLSDVMRLAIEEFYEKKLNEKID